MRILITGATGFIGRELVRHLGREYPGAELMCAVRNRASATEILGRHPGLTLSEGLDRDAIRRFDPEFVLHLAAYNTSADSAEVIDRLIDSNISYGVKLLDVVKDCPGLKLFVNTGSFSQYVDGRGDAYLYSATKTAFEVILGYYSSRYGIRYVTLVPYSVYGGERTVKRVMDYVVESVGAAQPTGMTPGLQQLDFIDVRDVVRAYAAVMEHDMDVESGERLHLGTGEVHSLREVAETVEGIRGERCNIEWGARPYRETDIMYACAPEASERVRKIWQARIPLEEGLRKMMEKR